MIELIFLIFTIWFLNSRIQIASAKIPDVTKNQGIYEKITSQLIYADKLFKERKFLASEEVYLKILKSDPKNANSYNRLGMIYSILKNYDDAIECFQIVCRINPSVQSYYNLGLAYLKNENYLKAASTLEKATVFKPTAMAYSTLAKAYQGVSNFVKAEWALERAVEIDPSQKNLILLAEFYRNQGDEIKVEEIYGRIRNINLHSQ